LRKHHGLAEDAPVEDVLLFGDGIDHVFNAARNTTISETVWRFAIAAEAGKPVTALIITEVGGETRRRSASWWQTISHACRSRHTSALDVVMRILR
jgi:hypothetical protein